MNKFKTLKLTMPQIRLLLELYEISQSDGCKTYNRMPDMLAGLVDLDLVSIIGSRVKITDKGIALCD